ncbi:MAG: bifunctional DNA-formamidopyrimidine glycosylase/DNA-(apurinic or apyrimidinic site) lyase [Chloroflexota bacterium]|nr:bifunctional DNA-formamidopyrimidine glycosylase/DNA-(apurinic or apyrimidinic site) lyase [Chloroflexota bacterium]
MPELPEVETTRLDLVPQLVGRRIVGLELHWPRTLDRPPSRAAAEALLVDQRITRLRRRGKYLLIDLASGAILVIHLRMSGRLGVVAAQSQEPVHLRAALLLDDGMALRFVDMRKFGRIYVLTGASELDDLLVNVGPEPLEDELTLAAFRERLAQRRTRLKALLLDQRFLAGLGNIYVDEALFRAGLHPLRSAAELTVRETARTVAINNGGTTFRSYRDGWGRRGRHRELLLVYDRQDQPCYVCGGEIEKLRVAGRGTHLCPVCQPLDPLAPATVAVRTRRVAELDAPYLAKAEAGDASAES